MQRIITASVLAPIALLAILYLPQVEFIVLFTIFFMIAGWEWSRLIKLEVKSQRIFLVVLLFAYLLLGMFLNFFLFWVALIWWLVAIYLFYLYSRNAAWWNHKTVRVVMGFLVLVPCWSAIVMLQHYRSSYLLFALFLIWAADTGAFFIGRKWGRHKLAPVISPGKSWEGLGGGIAFTLIIAAIGIAVLKIPATQWLGVMLLAVVVVFAAVVGDLFESMIKRLAGVKDSGHWLPGHGGLLDRIDSVTCALPIFALGMSLLHLFQF